MFNSQTTVTLVPVVSVRAECQDTIELFFGQVKSIRRGRLGTCTTANSIAGAQMIHAKQMQQKTKAGILGIYGCFKCFKVPVAVLFFCIFRGGWWRTC